MGGVTYLDAGLCDAALAGAGVLDDDEGVLPPSRQILLSLPPARLQAKFVQVHQPGRKETRMRLEVPMA